MAGPHILVARVSQPPVRSLVGLLTGTAGRFRGGERRLARRAQMLSCDGQGTALSGECRQIRHDEDCALAGTTLPTISRPYECCRHAAVLGPV